MAGLEIQPHSRRLSQLAVLGLAVLSAGGFGLGVARQASRGGPAPFPAAASQAAPGRTGVDIPDATPAPDMQVATTIPAVRRRAPPLLDVPPVAPDALPSIPSAVAVDASAVSPETPPPPPEPTPPTPEPPT